MLFVADGDMRQAINSIQACHFASKGNNFFNSGNIITNETVLHICDVPSIDEIKQIIRLAISRKVHESLRKMHAIYEQGYSVYDIVGTMHKVLLMMEDEVHKDKLFEMLRCMAELKKRVIEGLTTEIQLGEFIAKISMLV